jgi:hypothetical protein
MRRIRSQTVCEWAKATATPPHPGSVVGMALSTLGKQPINGLRHNAAGTSNGWYIWCGAEFSDAPDFFSPFHVEHVAEYVPQVVEYLDLPPGYRFLIDSSNYEDVWFDETLLEGDAS